MSIQNRTALNLFSFLTLLATIVFTSSSAAGDSWNCQLVGHRDLSVQKNGWFTSHIEQVGASPWQSDVVYKFDDNGNLVVPDTRGQIAASVSVSRAFSNYYTDANCQPVTDKSVAVSGNLMISIDTDGYPNRITCVASYMDINGFTIISVSATAERNSCDKISVKP